ncbi:hypothetical protein [Natronococcus roseus]|uniref:hypothetical protein n=1 Tax=Natronococcus roseus TaxID=1052014 RepID=UPI00374D8F89
MSDETLPAESTDTVNPDYDDLEDDDLVSLDETTLRRDEEGNLLPERMYVEELGGEAVARPLERDERKRFVEDLFSGDKDELTSAELAELFDKKIVAPDLGGHPLSEDGRVTERFVEEGLSQAKEDGFYIAVLLASDEHDIVRRIRGEFTESELELAKAKMAEEEQAGPRAGNRGR